MKAKPQPTRSEKLSDEHRTAFRRQIMACQKHPERVAILSVCGMNKCWECYLGRRKFERQLARKGTTIAEFYSRPQNQIDLFSHGKAAHTL